jgi:hypothetical protein
MSNNYGQAPMGQPQMAPSPQMGGPQMGGPVGQPQMGGPQMGGPPPQYNQPVYNNMAPPMGAPPVGQPQMGSNLISNWGPNPIYVKCITCQQRGMTRVTRNLSQNGLILFIILLLVAFPCAFCVLCCDDQYETKHYCCQCGNYLGCSNR